jgi:hypothetical protein
VRSDGSKAKKQEGTYLGNSHRRHHHSTERKRKSKKAAQSSFSFTNQKLQSTNAVLFDLKEEEPKL